MGVAYQCANCGQIYQDPPYSHLNGCFICTACHGVQFEQVKIEQGSIMKDDE